MTMPVSLPSLILVGLAALSPTEQHRSTAAKNLTSDDRARIAELGIRPLHAGAISVRTLATDHRNAQLSRLRALSHSPAQLAASDICDTLVAQPDGTAYCTGHADGPLGSTVAMRMTLAARVEEKAAGRYSFIVFNTKPLEAKGVFGWTELAKPNALKLEVDLDPADGQWNATTRMGVTMSSHADTAERVGAVLRKLDGWLANDLAGRS
jgi:hypothetical protein